MTNGIEPNADIEANFELTMPVTLILSVTLVCQRNKLKTNKRVGWFALVVALTPIAFLAFANISQAILVAVQSAALGS